MAHLGILLACEHYPTVSASPLKLDAQLRVRLRELGHEATKISVFDYHLGNLPNSVGDCDFWIVSGSLLGCEPSGMDLRGLVMGFLRGVAASRRELLGLHHGEHLLHAALACPSSPTPKTPAAVRVIRNPFRSFWQRDDLFRFDAIRRVVAPTSKSTELKFAA